MDKRLVKLLQSDKIGGGKIYLLDTYNQAVHEDVACTIRTNINTANHHFIMEKIKYIGQMSSSQNSRVIDPEGISYAVTNGHKDGEPKIVEKNTPIIYDDYNSKFPQEQDVIGTITTQIGNPAPRHGFKIVEPLRIPQATKQGYIEVPPGSLFDMSYPESKTRRGRVQEGGQVSPTLMASGETPCYHEGVEAKVIQVGNIMADRPGFANPQDGRVYSPKGLSPSVLTMQGGNKQPKIETSSYRIRKLTPRECFRLMGVTETDIDKIQQSGVSQSQQYKMAGNSIVVDVLEHIFRKMFLDTGQESQQLSLF